jgi:hypothetical protein
MEEKQIEELIEMKEELSSRKGYGCIRYDLYLLKWMRQ